MADIIPEELEELAGHQWQFFLWPKMWTEYKGSSSLKWSMAKLAASSRRHIPDESGIYTLIVKPNLAAHPSNACLMYVGKAKSLKERFGHYLNKERRISGRPKLFRLLT